MFFFWDQSELWNLHNNDIISEAHIQCIIHTLSTFRRQNMNWSIELLFAQVQGYMQMFLKAHAPRVKIMQGGGSFLIPFRQMWPIKSRFIYTRLTKLGNNHNCPQNQSSRRKWKTCSDKWIKHMLSVGVLVWLTWNPLTS